MAEEWETALEQAVREDDCYHKGWEDARAWYRDSFMSFFDEFKEANTQFDYPVAYFGRQDINDLFNELPEDAMDLLTKAGLNRGQP